MNKMIGQRGLWVALFMLCLTAQLCAAASLDAVVSLSVKKKERYDDCIYTVRNRSTRAIYYARPLMQFADAPKVDEHIALPHIDNSVWHVIRVRPDDSGSFEFACPNSGQYAAAYITLDESSDFFTLIWSRHGYEQ